MLHLDNGNAVFSIAKPGAGSLWYAERTIFVVGLVVALGFYEMRTSLAGQPFFALRLPSGATA